jgi:hypothetical protein
MNLSWGWFKDPVDIMEHVSELRFYGYEQDAKEKLLLIAEHIDNPAKLKQFEEVWLYGNKKYWPFSCKRTFAQRRGWDEWDWD